MKTQHTLWIAALPLVATLTTVTPHSFAQSSGKAPAGQAASSPDRAQIRKETAEANKAHRIEHGEAGQDNSAAPPDKTKMRQSTVSRAEVRKEAAAANKAHRIEHGESGQDNSAVAPDKAKAKVSTVKRADVKKETAAANKAGTLPHGEVEGQPATKP
jgi:hypothetical protein